MRLFNERRVLVDEHELGVGRCTEGTRGRVDALDHGGHALVAIGENVPFAEGTHVGVRPADVERGGGQESVAARRPPAANASKGKRDDLLAEQCDEPLHRAAERLILVAPAHRLAERNGAADGAERPAQELDRWASLLDAPAHDVAPRLGLRATAGLLDDAELADGDAELGREGLGRLRRFAVLERGCLGWTDDLFVEIELSSDHIGDVDRQSARRSQRTHGAVLEPHLCELFGGDERQRGECRVDERRRQLFDADLEQQGQGGRVWHGAGTKH